MFCIISKLLFNVSTTLLELAIVVSRLWESIFSTAASISSAYESAPSFICSAISSASFIISSASFSAESIIKSASFSAAITISSSLIISLSFSSASASILAALLFAAFKISFFAFVIFSASSNSSGRACLKSSKKSNNSSLEILILSFDKGPALKPSICLDILSINFVILLSAISHSPNLFFS